MTNRTRTLLGFGVAGGVLLVAADQAPRFALGMTAVLVLGVAITHANDIKLLLDAFSHATGH